jgi:hypothetical protein
MLTSRFFQNILRIGRPKVAARDRFQVINNGYDLVYARLVLFSRRKRDWKHTAGFGPEAVLFLISTGVNDKLKKVGCISAIESTRGNIAHMV